MLSAQFDGDVLRVRPDGAITSEDVATLTRQRTSISPRIRRSPA